MCKYLFRSYSYSFTATKNTGLSADVDERDVTELEGGAGRDAIAAGGS